MARLLISDFKPGWSTDRYTAIIKYRQQHVLEAGFETHHIIPESFYAKRSRPGPPGWLAGNPEAKTNKVKLTPKEHFLCHWLLRRMTGHKPNGVPYIKMMYALMGMRPSNKHQQRYNTPLVARIYESLKIEYAEIQRSRMLGDKNPMAGDKFYRSEEGEARRLAAMSGDKNIMKTEAAREAMRKLKTGKKRGPQTAEWLAKLIATRQGERNGMSGKRHREESKAIQREKASQMAWVNDGITSKRINKRDAQRYLDDGWLQGRHYVKRGPRGPYKKKQSA